MPTYSSMWKTTTSSQGTSSVCGHQRVDEGQLGVAGGEHGVGGAVGGHRGAEDARRLRRPPPGRGSGCRPTPGRPAARRGRRVVHACDDCRGPTLPRRREGGWCLLSDHVPIDGERWGRVSGAEGRPRAVAGPSVEATRLEHDDPDLVAHAADELRVRRRRRPGRRSAAGPGHGAPTAGVDHRSPGARDRRGPNARLGAHRRGPVGGDDRGGGPRHRHRRAPSSPPPAATGCAGGGQ